MTSKEYEQKLEALEREIAALRKETVEDGPTPKPPHPRWKPKRGKLYYTINIGNACAGMNTWDSDNVDGDIYSLGFVFKNEAETEFAIERLKVLAEIDEWSGEYGDPVSIAYYENDGKVESIAALYPNRGEAVFANYEDAENCIKAIGKDRLKKYYFMIPEEKHDDD